MKKPFLLIFLLSILGASSLKSQQYEAQNQEGEFLIDGLQENWPVLQMAEDSIYALAFSHGQGKLYVCLEVYDLKWQSHILLTGMTLWIDEKGKKKKNKGIHYPTGYKQREILSDPMRFREVLEAVQDQKNEIAEKLVSMELLNFYGKDSRTWGKTNNPDAINVKLVFDEAGSMIYEAAIPLEAVFSEKEVYADQNSKGFSIGWETGELGRPELRGDDAVGLSGSNPANPVKFNSEWDRNFQKELNNYRQYAVPEKFWIKRMKLINFQIE
ncbi:MAG: hypothetical protein R8P61_09295 [Bacteroidia bacterium]|nr:hypothetical protein [Bacteroidia bacterium]